MTQNDIIGLALSYAYAFGLLGLAEGIRKWRGYSQVFTRKLVHIGAGMWVWPTLALFDTWVLGIVPFGTFIIMNYIFYRYTVFKAMDTEDSTPGTVYFSFSITLLYALLWRPDGPNDWSVVATGGIMAMTWGDALASIVGQRWGRREYKVWNHRRTWEGSATMFIISFAALLITLLALPGSSLSPTAEVMTMSAALPVAVLAAVVATAAEAASPAGTDNLSVPLLTAAVLFLLLAV
jgi:dolichol kinase